MRASPLRCRAVNVASIIPRTSSAYEIETALERKIRVIPILVDNARMPRADELPPSLAPLVRQQAIEINTLTFDTKRLI